MSVGVVANETAVIDPDDAFGAQILLQPVFYLSLGERLVAVRGHETACGRKHGTLAVALNGTALEDEVEVVFIGAADEFLIVEMTVNSVVEGGLEFLAPAIETEIKEDEVPVIFY